MRVKYKVRLGLRYQASRILGEITDPSQNKLGDIILRPGIYICLSNIFILAYTTGTQRQKQTHTVKQIYENCSHDCYAQPTLPGLTFFLAGNQVARRVVSV